jgi:Tol biopolymer transport system component
MFIGIRKPRSGGATLLVEDGVVNKIGTNFGYTSWHPSGRLAVYSINKVRQFFHTARNEVRDVIDLDSALAYYLVDSKTVKTSPMIAQSTRLETYPAWSADGRHLYFCSAPLLWGSQDKLPPEGYEQLKYSLVRISYDLERDQWGEVETVLSARDTGQSILLPRISPDGRWLLFCMCNYSCFPVYQQSSDLYIMDLKEAKETGRYEYHRLDINSDQSESWHSWSSNSRWIVFSSKRDYGVFTRCYISYVDENGRAYKPLVLPQKDPAFYDSCLETFNTPELVTGAISATGERLSRVVRSPEEISVSMPITMATPKAAPQPEAEPWHE